MTLDADDPRPLTERDPREYAKLDKLYKKLDPSWKACENCGGIFVSVCTNGCHLSRLEHGRFVAMLKQ